VSSLPSVCPPADGSYIIFCRPEETDINCISSVGFSKYRQKLSWPMKIHCFPIVNVLKVQFSQGNMKGMSS
jgi:hypothetical protein